MPKIKPLSPPIGPGQPSGPHIVAVVRAPYVWPSPAPDQPPTPSTSTVAGFTVPAAVVPAGKNRGHSGPQTAAALYPNTLACDVRVITCALRQDGLSSLGPARRSSCVGYESRSVSAHRATGQTSRRRHGGATLFQRRRPKASPMLAPTAV